MNRIADIQPVFLRYPFPPSIRYRYGGGIVENMDAALVRVTSDNGEYGLGEITHGQFCYEPVIGMVKHFNRLLTGLPTLEINRAWELMYGSSVFWNRQGLGIGVMGGINIAMYDLAGKLLKLPVYQLLGGLGHSRMRAYASNGLFQEVEPLLADAERAREFGFRAYKMRIVTPETIVPLVTAFHEQMPEMDLIVDAVQGSSVTPWSIAVSKQIARKLEPHGVLWFEEPCRVEDIEGYVEIRQSTLLNIAGAESLPTALAFKPYLDREAFGLVQFDIATAGFTEGMKIANLVAIHRKPVAIHSWGTVVSALAGLHLALTLGNCAMTEYCFMDHPLNDRLSVSPVRPQSGYLHAPTSPGLGIRLDEALQREFPYRPSVNTMISTEERDIQLSL
ncbi:MAG: mandelate racemase/muconate lactonizing enzyme family protein [Acidobacteria bacterium]|nr:mandelate racemase/muconate lactonizing enzyme family protein [Acidobacteriota bacterium]MCI0718288.1 mandelate racemase/muconate lactonizing enzyme family protein [Acidobacteriota bacterium]